MSELTKTIVRLGVNMEVMQQTLIKTSETSAKLLEVERKVESFASVINFLKWALGTFVAMGGFATLTALTNNGVTG